MTLDPKRINSLNIEIKNMITSFLESNGFTQNLDLPYLELRRNIKERFVDVAHSYILNREGSYYISLGVIDNESNKVIKKSLNQRNDYRILADYKIFSLSDSQKSDESIIEEVTDNLTNRISEFYNWTTGIVGNDRIYEVMNEEVDNSKFPLSLDDISGVIAQMFYANQRGESHYDEKYRKALEFAVKQQQLWLNQKLEIYPDKIEDYYFDSVYGIKNVLDAHYFIKYPNLLDS